MTTTDWIQAIAMVVLVVITGIYVWRTHVISKASEKQAEASVKMAEEMRDSRYSESLPILTPTIPPILISEKLPMESLQSGAAVKVKWCNVGKGVAIDSRFSFWTVPASSGHARFFPPSDVYALRTGESAEVDYGKRLNDSQAISVPDTYIPRLEAEYKDIYERKITTVREFYIGEENNMKRVSLGDLYFVINGRRLGKEVNDND